MSITKNDFSGFGFYRIAAVAPKVFLAAPQRNAQTILEWAARTEEGEACLTVFPELTLTGYTCEDLLNHEHLLQQVDEALATLLEKSKNLKTVLVLGAPLCAPDGRLFNVAYVIAQGKILGAVPKSFIPNSNEYYERRWFAPGDKIDVTIKNSVFGEFRLSRNQIFQWGELRFAVEICEDLWAPIPPSSEHALMGANVILNLSASNELIGKARYRQDLVLNQSARLLAAYIYASAGPLESSKDLIFGGHLMIAENGALLAESERFQLKGSLITTDVDLQKLKHERLHSTTFSTQQALVADKAAALYGNFIPVPMPLPKLPNLDRHFATDPFVPSSFQELDQRSTEILNIQATSLARRLMASKSKTALVGVSGGRDSTWALLVTFEAAKLLAWSPERVMGITMPGPGTSPGTLKLSQALMELLKVSQKTIQINASVAQHLKDLGHSLEDHDIVFENAQARERTQILMDLANQENGIVVGTGDLSELCLGWCTFNGDHMSHYNVNSSLPKTLIQHLIQWYADHRASGALQTVLKDILATEISPELLPPSSDGKIQQRTEAVVGPYRIIDFFIYHYLRNGSPPAKIEALANLAFKDTFKPDDIKGWLNQFMKRFFSQQFKRSVAPAGPKIGTVSVSPRGDLRMPDELEGQVE